MEKPPHTIQRLAELILRPTAHYRTLPAYLRAVDRVVSVTSGVDVFPFNGPSSASAQPNGLMHPPNSAGTYLATDYTTGLGSDESLGGALLTPIPWLTNASFNGEDANILEGRMLSLNGLIYQLELTGLQKNPHPYSHRKSKPHQTPQLRVKKRPRRLLCLPRQQTPLMTSLMPEALPFWVSRIWDYKMGRGSTELG